MQSTSGAAGVEERKQVLGNQSALEDGLAVSLHK